jgi:hypothetical protein
MHLCIQVLVNHKEDKDKKADEKPPAKPNDPEIGVYKKPNQNQVELQPVQKTKKKVSK